MVRLMMRLMVLLLIMTGGLVTGTQLAGQLLPPAPVAVSILVERGENGLMTVSSRDLFYGGVYQRTLSGGRGMFWSENACYVLVPVVEAAAQASTLLDLRSGQIRRYPVIGYRLTSWSPDGRQMTLGFTQDGQPALAILDASTGGYRSLLLPAGEEAVQFTWSPDSRAAMLVTGSATAGYHSYLINTGSGSIHALPGTPAPDDKPPAVASPPVWRWSPDSRYIASSRRQAGIIVVNVHTGDMISLRDLQPFASVVAFAWLPSDGQIALFGLPDTGDGRPLNITAGTATIDTSDDLREYNGFVWSLADNTLRATGTTIDSQTPLHWSPDNRLLLHDTHRQTRILRVETGENIMVILPHRDIMTGRNLWSPDGRYLALSSAHVDGKMRLVDTLTGRIIEQPARDGTLEWFPDSSGFSLYNINSHTLEITRLTDAGAAAATLPVNGVTRICYPEAAS